MKRNLSEIKTQKMQTSIKNNDNNLKTSLTKSSSSFDFLLISNKTQSTMSTINIDSDVISSFNIESLTTLEDAISYFFNPNITPEPSSFIDYFKTIRYFMFNISLKRIFQKKGKNSSKNVEIIENLLNLQFLSIY